LFFELGVAALIVIVAGSRLTKLADELADQLNLASGWVGLILLATVTSLPELMTGGTATAIGNVDLALGAIFGSCSFNITLIVLLNALWRDGSVLRGVSSIHTLTSSFGLALIGLALLGIVLVEKFESRPLVAQVTETCWALAIFVTYLGCMRLTYRRGRSENGGIQATGPRQRVNRRMALGLVVTTLILVISSWWLAVLGDVLSVHEIGLIGRPLGATFVGAVFLALATSLPEIVTSIAAVRLGDLNLALGNIFGSNMFNIFVIPFLKGISVVTGESVMLAGSSTSSSQKLIAGLLAVLLTAIAAGSLTYQTQRKMFSRFGFDAVLIAVTYFGGMALLLMSAE
jgi:cation:H+ antiporter